MTTLKQAAKIEARLRRHANLMAMIEAQGVDREAASKVAYKLVIEEQKAGR